MSWLSQWLHPGQKYDAAIQQLQNYYNQGQGYRQPYMQQGQDAYKSLFEAMNKLKNPSALQDEWGKTYNESDTAKQAEQMAQQRGLESAGAQGLLGSSAAQQNLTQSTHDIAAADKEKYMNDMMQKYLASIGIGMNFYNTGASMAGQAGQAAGQMGENMGGLSYNKAGAGGEMFSGLGKGALDMIMQYLTGGMGQGGGGRGMWTPSSGG